MAGNPASGSTCRANGDNNNTSSPVRSAPDRHRSESESDAGLTAKSLTRLCSRDEEERAAALEELNQAVLVTLGLDRTGSARLSEHTLLHLLRLSCSCPLAEVRGRSSELLRAAQVTH